MPDSPSRNTLYVRRHRQRKKKGVVAVVNIVVGESELELLKRHGFCSENCNKNDIQIAVRKFLTQQYKKVYLQES